MMTIPESSLRERVRIEVEMVFVKKQWYSSKCQVLLQHLSEHTCTLVVSLDLRSLT